jgi:hypothetical protein
MLNLRRTWVGIPIGVLNIAVGVCAAAVLCLGKPYTPTVPSLVQVGDPLPPGAGPCSPIYPEITKPFNAAAKGTPLTSCPFAEQVRRAYAEQSEASEPTQLGVVSPVSRKRYEMQCVSAERYVTCVGGEDAVIYLYNVRA